MFGNLLKINRVSFEWNKILIACRCTPEEADQVAATAAAAIIIYWYRKERRQWKCVELARGK